MSKSKERDIVAEKFAEDARIIVGRKIERANALASQYAEQAMQALYGTPEQE